MSVHRVGDRPGEIGRGVVPYVPDPLDPFETGESVSCSKRVQGVAGDLFAMLQSEFRFREAVNWLVQTVVFVTGKGVELVNRALGREGDPPPLPSQPPPPNPTTRSLPIHRIHDQEALRIYEGLFAGLFGPWIQGSRETLSADEEEFVRLISKLAALKVCEARDNPPKIPGESVAAQIANRHPDLIPNAFLYLEAIGGPEKAAEVVKRVGDRLLAGVSVERVEKVREKLFQESAACVAELLAAVRGRDGDNPGGHELEILRSLKRVSPAILLEGDPRARREHEMVYIRSRYLETLQRVMRSPDPSEQLLFSFLAPIAAEVLAEVSVQGLDFALAPTQVDAYFFLVGEALAPKTFVVEGVAARPPATLPKNFDRRLSDAERKALLSVTQAWLTEACESEKTGQLVKLVEGPFFGKVDQGLTLILTADGRFNPKQLLPLLREQVGEAFPPPHDLRERQSRIVGEHFVSKRKLDKEIGLIGTFTNVGSGLIWTRRVMRQYPLLWRSAALRAWDLGLPELFQ